MKYTKYWVTLAIVFVLSFAVLGYYGGATYNSAPPIPNRVVDNTGRVLFTKQNILDGQNIWQSMGGQNVGTIWGHGAYVAPDWNADWLHKESLWILNKWSSDSYGKPYDQLNDEIKASLQVRLQKEMRTNTYNPKTEDILITPIRAAAFYAISQQYTSLFTSDPKYAKLRDDYALFDNSILPDRVSPVNAFFWWTTWACVTDRPGDVVTYTNNWPHEPLVGNNATGSMVVWSVASFVVLLAGIGGIAWFYAVQKHHEVEEEYPEKDPLLALSATPSMKATLKYFWVVAALWVVQVGLGALTAHYQVEGSSFYGIPLAKILPYSVTRSWHTQLAIFWIATAWLATGLFVAPAVSGYEPKYQRLGVNFLFVCLLIIVVGSIYGQWAAIMHKIGSLKTNFYFGHQGYEYTDLGRFWQLFLAVGLFLWFFLMARALLPAFKNAKENRHLLGLFLLASFAIPVFYIPGLMWGQRTHMALAEYWRWWVVHLWVEGFFEVFATAVIAFLFTRMGLLRIHAATTSVLFSTIIFLFGGIIGTFHHLYFSGTPIGVLAYGAVFSALEVVPLVLIGFEAYEHLTRSRVRPWVSAYKWPIYYFIAVAFWNLFGAGLFGFFINPPIALYYMQGLNTTAVHGHAALFGVYGMLGIGLTLFCLRGLTAQKVWKTGMLKFSFWAVNIGLILQILLSLLPIGLMQTWASVEHGVWYARSSTFMQQPIIHTFVWFRIIGDTIFALGALALGWFILGLKTGHSLKNEAYLPDLQDQTTIQGGK